MFTRLRSFFSQFLTKSRTINNQPLNQVSLIVIILIDIFILINVFTGLDDISRWHISPTQAYPCYFEWKNYRTQTSKDKDYEILKQSLAYDIKLQPSFQQTYQQVAVGHLGKVDQTCINYAAYKDKISNSQKQPIIKNIDQKQAKINNLDSANQKIRDQYDSTLLEKIAGQNPQQSINSVSAEKAKIQLEQNNRNISTLKQEISTLKKELIAIPESQSFLAFLKDEDKFNTVAKGYEKASFWYPSIQLVLQSLFLLPLIFVALLVHKFTQGRNYGLISLISWHLLVIFLIPLILKIFEFLQIGAIFKFISDIISTIFGGLLFLISYVYILLIPVIGFGIIKFLQKVVFNPKVQAAKRIQKLRCINCAKKIRPDDSYCPHCGYYQYIECENCHSFTYKHLPYCKECGYSQDASNIKSS